MKNKAVWLLMLITIFPLVAQEADLEWRFAVGGRILAPPACGRDSVYFVSEDRYIHALDAEGNERWEFPMQDRVSFNLSIGPDETVYASTEEGSFMAVNPAGDLLWRYDLGEAPVTPASISYFGTIATATSEKILYLNYRGRLLWEEELDSPLSAGLVMSTDGTVFYGTQDGNLSAIYSWGEPRWQTVIDSPAVQLAVDKSGMVHILDEEGNLHQVTSDGLLQDTVNIQGEQIESFVIIDDQYYVRSRSGRVYSVLFNGAFLVDVSQQSAEDGFAIDVEGRVYLLSDERILCDDGNNSWSFVSEKPFSGLVLSPDGLLLAGSEDWILYAFSADPPADGDWPQIRSNAGFTGCEIGTPHYDSLIEEYESVTYFIYLDSLADTEDTSTRKMVVDMIEEDLEEGDYHINAPYVRYILQNIGEAELTRAMSNRSITDDPLLRSRIYRLIGETGYMEAREFLIDASYKEKDSYALSAILEALGLIGSDPNGGSLDAIFSAITNSLTGANADNALAVTALNAMLRIHEYNGRFNAPSGYDTLVAIVRGPYNQQIRMAAMQLME